MVTRDRLAALLARGDEARLAGRIDDASAAFAAAIAHCRTTGDLVGQAQALRRQAQIARDAGDLDWALHDQQEAVHLYRLAGDGVALAHALRHAGDMFLEQHRLAHATACIREALDLYGACPDARPLDVANAVRSGALLAEAMGEDDAARRLWRDAEARYAALDDVLVVEPATGNPGVIKARTRLGALGA
jgi:tetratricopeptide (TPR) repeat protein